MTAPVGGEMPFLEHLEELRSRLLKVLGAVFVACVLGIWAVQRFKLVVLLKQPIEQYLPNGKLTFTSPTEPLMIVFKLGLVAGLVVASPVIIYQVWAFLSPALYEKERRILVPTLVAGLALFLLGGLVSWLFVVPQALSALFAFQNEALEAMITYDNYFGIVLQLVLALGISFELPLVLMVLASLGLVTPASLARFRRFAVVLAFILGAVISPGTDPFSMLMLTIPLLLLYELGVAGVHFVHGRRLRKLRASAMLGAVLLLLLGGSTAHAQQPSSRDSAAVRRATADSVRADSLRRAARDSTARTLLRDSLPRGAPGSEEIVDSLRNTRVGLPVGPTRRFAEEDSIMKRLKAQTGFTSVRFRGDSANIDAAERTLQITGAALTERDGAILEADSISYDERDCLLVAGGDPKLFQGSKTLIGGGIKYDTCRKRGVVLDALTTFPAQGTTWFLRGNVAQDSSTTRIFATNGDLTSCDLPVPHFSFRARRIKWLADEVLVARPVVLYLRDVPLLWLPFVFKDLSSRGRKSGILIPRVGIADLVRTSSSYQRQITNFGYYFAASDYYDVTLQADWYSGRNVRVGGDFRYNVLHRFLNGNFSLDRIFENGGGSATQLGWSHNQAFSIASSLRFNLDYSTSTRVLQRNTVDPLLSVQQLASGGNYQRRFRWGSANLGGNRRQNISDGSGSQSFPELTISPNALALSRAITWSPGLSISNDRTFRTPAAALLVARADGGVDTLTQTTDTRLSRFNLDTPFRFGNFQWQNQVSLIDRTARGRFQTIGPAPVIGSPTDSQTVLRAQAGTFASEFDWSTSINLPLILPSTWRIQPSVGVLNTTPGALAIRNERTAGQWVTQSKRFSASVTSAPALFGFLPGIVPGIARIRHSVSPQFSLSYAPAAAVPRAYAEAIALPGQTALLRSQPQLQLTMTLQQSFEGKTRPAPDDSSGATARKIRLLSISTSPITYDFEQAKLPGMSGWATGSVSNSFLSELLPGFNVSTQHELFRGQFSSDTAAFSPFLSGLQATFSLSNRTFDGLFRALGLARGPAPTGGRGVPGTAFQGRGVGQGFFDDSFGGGSSGGRFVRAQGFNATLSYTLTRQRRLSEEPTLVPLSQQSLNFSTTFSPTPLWNVSWQGNFNATLRRFESQSIRLERDLHEWRASFSYSRVANGNSAFYVSLGLIDIPQLKLDYNRTSLER